VEKEDTVVITGCTYACLHAHTHIFFFAKLPVFGA